jgi:mono/diheme cytochrome c family protein
MFHIKSCSYRKILGLFLSLFILSAFSHTSMATYSRSGFIYAYVNASGGGTFTDNPDNPSIKITIPAGALSANARLVVRPLRRAGRVGPNQTAASRAYSVKLRKIRYWKPWSRWNHRRQRLSLNAPMQIEITAKTAPVHPQIGEIAIRRHRSWPRMMANFYKASTNSVVTQTKNIRGKYRVAHRTLQSRPATDAAVVRGRELYFNDDWGSHEYWTGTFQLNELLNADIVTPAFAASLGLQIDVNKVPQPIVDALLGDDFAFKQAALNDHNLTVALLKAGAVLGLTAQFNDTANPDRVTDVGLTCALCHVTVDPIAFQIAPPPAPLTPLPIGQPIIGPPNAGIALGTILANTPLVAAGSELPNRDQYLSWAPGSFDPRFMPNNPIDDGVNNPSQIPQHWNYIDLAEQDYDITWIGILHTTSTNESLASGPECGIDLPLGTNGAWGTDGAIIKNFEFGNTLPQWVFDALDLAEVNEPGIGTEPGVTQEVTKEKLLDLKAFMESIVSPPPGDFDEAKAAAGWKLFYGKANCVACHRSAEFTRGKSARGDISKNAGIYFTNIVENEPQGLLGLGIKVPQLRGIASTAPYFHDGSAATLADVVARYTSPDIPQVPSTLTADEQASIVEYMKSL